MLLYKDWMPDWKNATVHQQSGSKTVEVPLLLKKWIGLISEEIAAEYERTKDTKYLQNYTKLIIKTDLKSGEMADFIMQISPSLKYFEQSRNLDNSSYLDISKDFDGSVFYYNPNWIIINGFKYSDGRIIGKFNRAEKLADIPISSRASDPWRDCFLETTYGWTEWSFNNNDLIYMTNFYMYTEVKCYFREESGGNEYDGGYSPEGGSAGSGSSGNSNNNQNQTNQPKNYQSSSTDKLFRTSLSQTMETQMGGTCVLASMGYVNSLFGGNTNYGEYIWAYAQLYHNNDFEHVLYNGVYSQNIPSFVSRYFNTTSFTSYQQAIDNGHLVLTDIPTGQSYSHCVTIVGYHSNGDLIYMDPELGVLRECPASYPLGNIKITIIGNK